MGELVQLLGESLEVALRPSRRHLVSILVVYGVSTGLILGLSLSEEARWGLLAALCLGLAAAVYRLRAIWRITRLAHRGGRWVVTRGDRVWPLSACATAYLSNWLIVLRIKETGRRAIHLPIFRDTCDTENFRQLALWLRTTGA